jgi:hypothetical protein
LIRIEKEEYDFIEPHSFPTTSNIQATSMQPQPTPMQPSNKKKKTTKSGTKDYMIDSVHLSLLVSSYHKYFNEYSNIKKNSSDKFNPSLVWKIFYLDYIKKYPNSLLKKDSLKEKLRTIWQNSKQGLLMKRMLKRLSFNHLIS